jgi:NAD(P)-dependent dehydrogenase (short-subunit alcohol dehydrogenase family)
MFNDRLRGKVAFITGGGSGLGEACGRAFARAGCAVACVDLRIDAAERVSAELRADGAESISIGCDVSDDKAVFAAVGDTAERFGRIDIVVNCAAIDWVVSVADMPIEHWDKALAVNLRGPFLTARAVWPHMQRQKGGHIFNICSTAAVRAWGNAAAYHATKWGLRGFSRGLGVEGRPHNIRVTTVIPGGMRTHWFDKFPEQGLEMPDERHLQDPAIVAEAIIYAATMPAGSSLQELILTPLTETSWP